MSNPSFSFAEPWRERALRIRNAEGAARTQQLQEFSRELRICILKVIQTAGLGHIGGDYSAADVIATLYGSVLRFDAKNPAWPERDRFILSKGHCSAALYSVLALNEFISVDSLGTFAKALSPLNAHPNRQKVPGVETNTGPLGHGLPVAVGCAVGAQLANERWNTYVLLGDGELQEGSNWEAVMFAAHRKLSNLTAIVDRNRLQQGARTEDTNQLEPLGDKWRAFGWDVIEVDGHDHEQLYAAITKERDTRPRCIIARTVKGKGVSFMEDGVEWHHKVPSSEQCERAYNELGVA